MSFLNTIPASLISTIKTVACFTSIIMLASFARAGDLYAPLSPNLAPEEQAFMRAFLGQLNSKTQAWIAKSDPSTVNLIVVDASEGAIKIHTNRPEDAAKIVFEPEDSRPIAEAARNVLPPCHGPFERDPQGDYNPGCNSQTGPYRRIYTKAAPPAYMSQKGQGGSYRQIGTVTIACNAGTHAFANGDGPNAYLGGWSSTPNAKYSNLDAGIQYNLDLTKHSTNSYSPFMHIDGAGYIKTEQGPTHINCSEDGSVIAFMAFEVQPYSVVVNDITIQNVIFNLIVEPVFVGNASAGPGTAVFWVPPPPAQIAGTYIGGGWGVLADVPKVGLRPKLPCTGCIFKWMTSIGQTVGHPNYRDGATYAATWNLRSLSGWRPSYDEMPLTADMIFCSEYPLWFGTYDFGTRDCGNTPPKQNGIAKAVAVTNFSPEGETDSISLSPKN